jgi:hypothetical protein
MDKPLRRGGAYFARLIIPKARRADVGKAYKTASGVRREVVRTLQTSNRGEALQRLPEALAALRQEVDEKLRTDRRVCNATELEPALRSSGVKYPRFQRHNVAAQRP